MRTHDRSGGDKRATIVSSIWLRVGFIGATATAAGLLQLLDGDLAWLSGLTLALCGSVLAAVSWSQARATLDFGHPPPAHRPSSLPLGGHHRRTRAGSAAE